MPDERNLSSDSIEKRPRSSMTLNTTLDDGTTINLAVSPASTVTASTSFTHTSFSFHISTSLPNHDLASRKLSRSPESHSSPISSPLESTPKPTSTFPHPVQSPKPSTMSLPLPEDVVAIDTSKKSLLFYVYTDKFDTNRLSYLESSDEFAKGIFKVNKIKTVRNDDDPSEDIVVSSQNKQVAAVTWVGPEGIEIRVYYVSKGDEVLREVCKTGDGEWTAGALSLDGNSWDVRPGTSISASVHYYKNQNNYNLRVFASKPDPKNIGPPRISVFKFWKDYSDPSSTPTWQGNPITDANTKY
ncbi:hypothetical protein H9Q74_012945 [Fusarium xylarioides]|nr:hypothetical protein H9Q71_013779 [Fusarium xylarioides]KAG5812841.1 hypothetical protein H9Q74_012945 [Fusarium xylarioides]